VAVSTSPFLRATLQFLRPVGNAEQGARAPPQRANENEFLAIRENIIVLGATGTIVDVGDKRVLSCNAMFMLRAADAVTVMARRPSVARRSSLAPPRFSPHPPFEPRQHTSHLTEQLARCVRLGQERFRVTHVTAGDQVGQVITGSQQQAIAGQQAG
jgi:hypothetical protein